MAALASRRVARALSLLLLCAGASTLTLPVHRRSTLLSRSNGTTLGWVDETLSADLVLSLSVHCCGDDADPVEVTLPPVDAGGQLMSSCLWPPALATAVLLRQQRWRDALEGRACLELGAGLGLTGVVAAHAARSCTLTDHDGPAVEALRRTAAAHALPPGRSLSARALEWKDFIRPGGREPEAAADLVLGTDVAYYHPAIRPLMDAISAHLEPERGLMLVAGQANRGQQLELRKNLRDGCYNQITDEHEPPWGGATALLLYDLEQRPWQSLDVTGEGRPIGGVSPAATGTEVGSLIPIAAIVYAAAGEAQLEALIGENDHVATKQDEEEQMITF